MNSTKATLSFNAHSISTNCPICGFRTPFSTMENNKRILRLHIKTNHKDQPPNISFNPEEWKPPATEHTKMKQHISHYAVQKTDGSARLYMLQKKKKKKFYPFN